MPANPPRPIAKAIAACSGTAAVILGVLFLVDWVDGRGAHRQGIDGVEYLLLGIGAALVACSALVRTKRGDAFIVVALALVGAGFVVIGASLLGMMHAGMH